MNLELLKKLCNSYGTSGNEQNVRDFIISEIKPYVTDVKIDNLGNVIVYKKGINYPSKKLLISAHMDEVGFIVTHITDEGLIKFSTVGGIDVKSICGKSVVIGKNFIPGVIGLTPIHLIDSDKRLKSLSIHDLYVDIGATNMNDALVHINLGDCIYFNKNYKFEHNMIQSKALDDRVGCYILIEFLKQDLPYDMYFSFVVQEEVGLRGAKVAAFDVAPDAAIVVETTTASDIKGVTEDKQVCKIGKGAVISFMDKSTIYSREYYDLAFKLSEKNNIKIQTKSAVVGGNDAGAIHTSRSGVKTIAVSLPCRYLHTGCSMIDLNDLIETQKIVKELAFSICS